MHNATIEILEDEQGQLAVRLLHPANAANGLRFKTLSGLPPHQVFNDAKAVENYGFAIFNALCAHSAIKTELNTILNSARNGGAALRFLIGHAAADSYRWEAICSPPAFFSLNNCCIVRSTYPDEEQPLRYFEEDRKLRLKAFLSPAPIDADRELLAIVNSIKQAADPRLEIECQFFVGQQSLLDRYATPDSLGKFMTVSPMPGSTAALEKAIREQPAEIVHFFCHGRSDPFDQLEFGTISDYDTGDPPSVLFSIERLQQIMEATRTTWITVLNCCLSAYTKGQVPSMATKLVKQASPISIGMADFVQSENATAFSGAFYAKVFEELGSRLPNGGLPQQASHITLDLSHAVNDARSAVHNSNLSPPQCLGHWSLPLFYQLSDPFIVRRIKRPTRVVLDNVIRILRDLPRDTPRSLRDELLDVLLKAGVPAEMCPDAWGNAVK